MKRKAKRNNVLARLCAGLLALVLLLSLCPAALAAESSISIKTLAELETFAKRCSSDSYSKGLTVTLTADIDARGTAVSVPIFFGTFDGQGHKITGLQLTESNSVYGLFSCIGEDAEVKNLAVEGEVTPAGTQNIVGGIAGENQGAIRDCSFSGVVIGSSSVGGIAGKNSGTIIGCTAAGAVRGRQYTGGVAGQNSGTLLRCESTAAVNTTVSEADVATSELQSLENTVYSILKDEEITETAVASDTGGIVGYSTGVVQSCTNMGSVGYPHVGYNVGGIAGRQNGYLSSCINRGPVQGRKDVGGIVGQMVPDITLQFSQGGLDELQSELNGLQNLINRTLDDAQSASDTISGRVARISGYADSAKDSAHGLAGNLGDFADSNIDTANNLLLLVERYITKAAPIMDDLAEASASMTTCVAEVRTLVGLLDGTLEYTDTALAQMQSFCGEMEAACNALLAGLDAMENAFSLLENGLVFPDTTQLRADTAVLLTALEELNATIQTAIEEYQATGSVSAETQVRLSADLQAAFEAYSVVVADLGELFRDMDMDGLRDQNEETLRQVLAYLQTAMNEFYSATSHMSAALGYLDDAMGTLRTINDRMEEIFAQLDTVLSAAQQTGEAMTRAANKAAQWVRDLSTEDPGSFSPLGPEFDENNDALNTSLNGISNELSALNSEINSSSTVLLSDLRAVNDQFMNVMNLFLNVLNSTWNVDYTDVYEDVSEESLYSATRGKVQECSNFASVTADRNVGGIAGAMAIEYDADPEDDLLSSNNRSMRFTYQTKAILLDCSNYGSVQAKKNCAGGIAGRMDLGTISGCGGWGNAASESGDYVGGVAGLALSSIRSSYAKCSLSGGKYVGGIAGSGHRISDCISMVEVTECTQLGGAVAGEITDTYSGNRFVSDVLAGVDRVSYSGKAEQISYEQLLELADIPEEFRRLTLRFVANGKTLKEQKFDYGASFTDEVYPDTPAKEGYYVRWDVTDLSELHFDTVVTAVYEPYITTLTSGVMRDGRDALLVEGDFREGDSLRAGTVDGLTTTPEHTVEAWSVQIPEDGQSSHTVRWLIPSDGEKAYAIYQLQGSSWQWVHSEKIGSYLCFELSGDEFAVVPVTQIAWWEWAAAAGVSLVLLCAVVIHHKHKKTDDA